MHEGWRKTALKIIGEGYDGVDIAVGVCSDLLPFSPDPAEETAGPLCLGQEVRFAGFPRGLYGGVGLLFSFRPMPFLKQGIVSCMAPLDQPIYIDAFNTKGFSGGPVWFVSEGKLRLCAVVSGYPNQKGSVLDSLGNDTDYVIVENTGITFAFSIRHANRIIEQDPCGLTMPVSVFNAFRTEEQRTRFTPEYLALANYLHYSWGLSVIEMTALLNVSDLELEKIHTLSTDTIPSEDQLRRVVELKHIDDAMNSQALDRSLWIRESRSDAPFNGSSAIEIMLSKGLAGFHYVALSLKRHG